VPVILLLLMALVAMTPSQRKLRAQMGAHASWSRTKDPSARTKPARDAWAERFLNEVDPERVLSPEERARRAEHAKKAYMARLAFASAKARRRNKAAK